MFTHIMERNVPEERGDALWNQCLAELQRVNKPVSISLKEVDRLALLVSHRVHGDYTSHIQEAVAEVVNGFMDDLPF